jgi:hypothetical protein
MHSFALPLVATIFFGAFSSAIPLPQSIPSIPSLPGGANAVSAVTKAVARTVGNDLQIRETPRAIAVIVSEAQSKITPLTKAICMLYFSTFSWVDLLTPAL